MLSTFVRTVFTSFLESYEYTETGPFLAGKPALIFGDYRFYVFCFSTFIIRLLLVIPFLSISDVAL
jgi:hypothetical protein